MFSQVEFWHDGSPVWNVEHFGDISDTHLKSEGMLPAVFNAFRQEQKSRASDEQDFFDIPIRMADHVTGYRYDRIHAWENGTPYTVLGSTTEETVLEILVNST